VIRFLSSEIPDAYLAVHLFRTCGKDQRNREKSRKEALHRRIGDREIEEAKNLDTKHREIPILDIPIRSGPSDPQQIWIVEKSKDDFSHFGDLKAKGTEKARSAYTRHVVTLKGDQGPSKA
jgi:hypothetical protein